MKLACERQVSLNQRPQPAALEFAKIVRHHDSLECVERPINHRVFAVPCGSRMESGAGASLRTRIVAYFEAIFWAISQLWPPGSTKFAVRMPHGLSRGPLSDGMPRLCNSRHTSSTSSTQMLS